MNSESLLLTLRIISGLLLIAFFAAVLIMQWQDYRLVSHEIESRSRNRGRLRVTKTNQNEIVLGMTYPLLPLTTLGRAITNTIHLSNPFTSSEHATITLRGGQWWLADRGSSNGTLLNGYRISDSIVLSTGDLITVGQVEFRVELD